MSEAPNAEHYEAMGARLGRFRKSLIEQNFSPGEAFELITLGLKDGWL